MSADLVTELSATELISAALAGERIVVLDVRADGSWPIEAPGVEVVHVPADDALARAGELPPGAVAVCARGLTARRVADAMAAAGVPASVLEGGMRGWLAALRAVPVETSIPGLSVLQVQRPGRGCLSYLLAAGGEALVVDPAPDGAFYAKLADELGVRVTTVADTHLHADHLSGARELAQLTGAALRLPAATLERDVAYADSVEPLADGDLIRLGDVEMRAVALPGHTTDMTGFLVGGSVLLSGDSLFADGIARPDLQRGDPEGARAMARELHATLRERVLSLADDTILLPGHDRPGLRAAAVAPTLGEVRRRVPELALADPDELASAILADMPPRPENYLEVIEVNAGRRAPDRDLEVGGNSCATR